MDDASRPETLGVYVSVPFCRAKCSFCNFASGVGTGAQMAKYVAGLVDEIGEVGATAAKLGARLPRRAESIYFGGGTPSLLLPEQLGMIFETLWREFAVADDAEITLEAAPGQIADELLQEAMRCGVNRVSLGVQSFVDRECAAVGRSHTEADCVREIERLRAAGVGEVGADLIAGLPHQTMESWEYSLRAAVRLAEEGSLTHLSVYMFEVDEESRLGREVLGGGARMYAPQVPADDDVAEMYLRACEVLEAAGFVQYEISNFAWCGCEHESRHNRKYWERAPYVGFGLDAHSMLECDAGAVRFANAEELEAYRRQPQSVTVVGEREACEERVFLGLRLSEGVDAATLCEPATDEMMRAGFMTMQGGRAMLTTRGRMVSNEVFGVLLDSMKAQENACPDAPRATVRETQIPFGE